ncbi:MAG: DUF2461 domain-containing protein [Clostridiales bacterium]|nr:DUF2461 domain-containing protein [Candidatus Cacconaster stercorequi]
MFQGYTQETVDFMWGIRFNNEREWFLPRKEIYQQHLLQPTKELAAQVYDGVHAAVPDEPLLVKVSRIYRDARRLHGRGPYKDHLWFSIRTGDQDWTGRPTFYFEIAPEYYSYGMGFWCAKAATMQRYRQRIDRDPRELTALVEDFNRQNTFVLAGADYVRSKGEVSELLRPWYQKKSINLHHEGPLDERIFSPELADDVLQGFLRLMPFYRYFAEIIASQTE